MLTGGLVGLCGRFILRWRVREEGRYWKVGKTLALEGRSSVVFRSHLLCIWTSYVSTLSVGGSIKRSIASLTLREGNWHVCYWRRWGCWFASSEAGSSWGYSAKNERLVGFIVAMRVGYSGRFYRGQIIKIDIIIQKYQNTNENCVCIISPNAYDAQQNDHR